MAPLIFEESGFRVTAPDPAFRFADMASYRDLSGKHLKEMDVGWWEKAPNGTERLLLLELKGVTVWKSPPDDPTKPHEHLVRTCVEKATDSLLMLLGAWNQTPWGQELAREMPPRLAGYPGEGAIKFVFLIDIPAGSRELLSMVAEKIKGRLEGQLGIFGIKSVSVIDFQTAQKKLPVTRI